MRILRSLISLLFMVVCIVLVAGCVSPQDSRSATVLAPPAVTTPMEQTVTPATSAVPSPTPAPAIRYCPDRGNESPWIALAPVSDSSRGDRITIHGDTNLPAGKTIEVRVFDGTFHPHCKCCFDDTLVSLVKVHNKTACNNTFSVTIDTTSLIPQEYMITSTDLDDSEVNDLRIFTLYDNSTMIRQLPPVKPRTLPANTTLIIDLVPDVRQGETLEITGYTALPERALRFFIRDTRYIRDSRLANAQGLASGVIHPKIYGNVQQPFALRFDTTDFSPGKYMIRAEGLCYNETVEQSFNVVPV